MKIIFYVCLALLCFIVQTTSFHFLSWLKVYPDVVLALSIHGGLRWGKIGGLQFGGAVGFVQDLLSFGVLGINMLSKSLIGFTVGALREKYISDSTLARIVIIVSATILDLMIYRTLSGMLIGNEIAGFDSKAAIAQSVINLVFTLLVLPVIIMADREIDRRLSRRQDLFHGKSFLD
ncbi:Lead, cadmium, zinc and mercury transporting ATPase; Copper-translocating P-type ATPase [hydrothermal vent metagenome]|uniref:Lead, cadmium, zinc and mercury transporting ATPase Copper-translocating P-type ATPase n=1 Tax=hydrothermal vent metagenome TaxID=652676 RepID=A0A3B1CKT7_9ZZZZ